MASPLLLIILKGRCFISCECQISAIYIPQLQRASEWLLIFVLLPEMYGSGRETIGQEKRELSRAALKAEDVMVGVSKRQI